MTRAPACRRPVSQAFSSVSGMLAAAVNYGFGAHDRNLHPADVYLDRFAELAGLVIKTDN